MDERNYIQGVSLLCLLVLFLGVVPMVGAFQEKEDLSQLDKLVMTIPEMRLPNESVKVEQMDDLIFQQDALFDFKSEYGDNWSMYVDIRRNVTSILKGGAIPFIPGKANKLTWEDFGATCSEAKCIPFEVIEDLTHDFLVEHKDLLGIIPSELVLRPENAVSVAHMVFVNYTQVVNGVPVEGATVNFRINRGNLLHVATEDYAPVKISTIPSISLETALDTVRGYLGEFSLQRDKIVDAGSLRLVPITPRGNNPDLFKGPVGTGYNHALAWRFVFVREGIVGQWEALVDAHSGELLRFVDINRYGMAHGYVYPGDNHNNEADRVFPFAHTNLAAPNDYTTEGGYFPGDSATIDLELGKFCRINDSCGSTALTTTTGDADFGLSLGTDCDVPSPNLGGPGNTWSSKVQFYHLTMINIKARTYYPTNTWLTTGYITCNVNQSAWCNATSSSGTLNFYQTAPPCWNLGELPGVSLHEWGHSWDDLDGSGGTSPPLETRADWSAAIMLHDSCCGRGAGFSGCGYGDDCTNCDGVRDNDYWYHTSQTPWTATNHGTFWGPCSGGSYYGPCGGEDHCEAGISSQALWDMVKGDNPGSEPDGDFFTECGLDLASGWQLNDLLFWTSHAQLGDMYNCTSWVSTGCSGNTLYELFMSIDDDGDGTANGTPHAAGIFAALDRHEIACGASTDPENQNHTNVECPDLAEPQNFSGYGQNNQVVLDWDTVTDADRYDIYRNESGCSAGFTKVGEVSAPTTTFTDTNVVNNITYYFRVQAYAEELPDCTGTFGPISDCVTATPFPCTMPGTPTNLVATAGGDNIINLTWTDGSPAADTFNIYRAVGTCPQTAYALIASGVSSTSYSDDPVSGQVTFAYVVTAVDITGLCETVYSNCDDAITTGTCTEPPTFAGIQSVTNPGNAICTLDLAWNAGTAHCGGPVLYHVYRSTTSGFTPGSGNLIASVYSTSHNDMNSLVTGTTYYYVVRAEDETNGSIETNLVELSGTPYGPGGGTQVIFSDDFETDTGWTIAGTGEWERAAPQGLGGAYGDPDPTAAVSGTYVLGYDLSGSGTYLGDYENSMSAETTVTSPAIDCTGVTSTQVSFQRWLGVESSSYDHARLYASNDGTNWTTVWSNGSTMSDGAWGLQSYDISAVADNQATVYIRFGMGTTDGSMTYCGWNIDDLEVSGWVDSPCTTGSGCPGNPFVDVSPNGPLTLCEGTSQLLTVNLSGGTSPFQYQWTEDGIDISGATNSTYTANFTDTHAYNCKVRGSGCSDDATDGAATSITWQYEPTFGGITSALDGGIGACTINLAWNAATSACPGPIRYSVYRDTVSPVDTIPANRIAENLSATSYSDTYNLVNGTTYYYVVHAIDLSNSAEDTNTVELSATATFTFGGITSAVSGGLDTCTIDLTWNAATSSCPGPFLYSVYRDTVTPVDTIPANRIVSGVSGTSYADDDTLVNGTTYYYVVHAVDQSSFNEDTNTVEASAAPYGPGGGTQTFLDEDFDTAGIPGTWTIVDGNSDSWTWYEDDSTDPAGCANTDPASPIGGIWATVDSDCNSVDMDEQLITPVINLSTTATVSLEFDHYFNRYGAEYADVDVRSTNTGGVWTNVAQWTADTANPLHSTIDITAQAAGASDVQIRWHYYDANYEWYWYVDNILVTGYVAVACTTGSGCTDPGQPIITGITDLNGCAQSGIQVAYTAGSGATSHDLYRDSNLVVTGYVSGATYNPGDTSSHNYIIRAIDGACYTDSTAVAGTDANNTPGAPVISSVTDLDACAATGVSIVFTAGSGATSHNLWVDGSQAVTGITSPYTYVPGNTSSHSYVVRAINGSCYANSNAVAGTDANNTPGAPVISSVTDLDACAATGVSIVFTAGSGATSHNLWVDGSQTVTGITSPYTYVPGNTSSHSYVVRAINGSCYANSNAMAGTDVNNGVTTAPVISSVTDLDACAATGVSVVFTAGSPASSHNLWVDGSQAVTGITSPYTYVPGDTSSHSYVVRAINGSCYANSNAVAGTDVDDAVITTPVITDITDPDPYTYTGLIITYTAGSPSTSHDLWMDGALLVTGFNSGDTTPAEDGNSHSYFIRAWNNTCYADSLPEMYYPPIPPIPPEITPIDWTDKTTLSWPEETTSTLGYILYRGELANLADLLDTDTDFCTRWTGSSSSDTSATGLSETATGGDCYYYLVTGVNSNGEGSAGEATAGARIVNTTGACP